MIPRPEQGASHLKSAPTSPISTSTHLEAVGAAVKVDIHDSRCIGATLRRQCALPVGQPRVAKLAVRLLPARQGRQRAPGVRGGGRQAAGESGGGGLCWCLQAGAGGALLIAEPNSTAGGRAMGWRGCPSSAVRCVSVDTVQCRSAQLAPPTGTHLEPADCSCHRAKHLGCAVLQARGCRKSEQTAGGLQGGLNAVQAREHTAARRCATTAAAPGAAAGENQRPRAVQANPAHGSVLQGGRAKGRTLSTPRPEIGCCRPAPPPSGTAFGWGTQVPLHGTPGAEEGRTQVPHIAPSHGCRCPAPLTSELVLATERSTAMAEPTAFISCSCCSRLPRCLSASILLLAACTCRTIIRVAYWARRMQN